MTATQNEISNILKENYDCILKIDAIHFIKAQYGSFYTLGDIAKAYNHTY